MKLGNGSGKLKWEMGSGNGKWKWEVEMGSVIGSKKRMAPTGDAILFVLS